MTTNAPETVDWRVLDAAPDAMLVVDEFSRIRFANARVAAVFGHRGADLEGVHLDALLPAASRAQHAGHVERLTAQRGMREMGAHSAQLRGLHKNGLEFPIEIGLNSISLNGEAWVVASIRDITASKRADEAVRTQLQLDASPVAIVRLDCDARITHVNEAWRRFARENGANDRTAHGIGMRYMMTGDAAGMRDVVAGHRAAFSCTYPCHSGTEARWFRLEAKRIAADDVVVVTHTNITDQHSAEGRLRVQAAVAQALAENLPLAEACDRLVQATCDSLEWDGATVWLRAESVEQPWAASLLPQDGHPEIAAALAWQVCADQQPEWIQDLAEDRRFAGPESDAGAGSAFAVPFCVDGRVFAVVQFRSPIRRRRDGALVDLLMTSGAQLGLIARRRMAEQRAVIAEAAQEASLRQAKAQELLFAQVLNTIPDLVLVKRPDSQIVWANAALRTLYGMPEDSAEPLADAPFNQPEHVRPYAQDDAIVFASGKPLVLHDEAVTRFDGEVRRFHVVKSPIFDAAGQVVMIAVVCHDLTAQSRLQAQLRLADRMASVGTLAAGIAHEINTPVQFVSDSIHFLRDSANDVFGLMECLDKLRRMVIADAPPAELQAIATVAEAEARDADLPYLREHVPKAFERCLDGLERVGTIVRSMKEFAHPAQNDMAPVDLNRAIQTTLTIARSEYKFVADLETEFGDLPPVQCYLNDINQVVLNVVVNAAHAIGEVVRDGDRKGTIKVRTWQEGADVMVAISDTGAGIPEAIAAQVFEMFFTTKEVGKGTGQGLALAWAVIKEKHGGVIRFESKPGQGTTFIISLPIAGKARDLQ